MKTEIKVLGTVAAAILGIELVMRPIEPRLSLDVAHIRSIPQIATAVAEAGDRDELRILFLGNSLTRSGVDDGRLKDGLKESGVAASTFYVYPDGSSITPWTYIYRDQFIRREILPEVVVVGFGRSHLKDGLLNPTVLSFFAGRADIGRVLTNEVSGINAGIEFLLSKMSVAFAHRHRVQPRVFSLFLPHYQEAFQEINDLRISEVEESLSEDQLAHRERHMRLEEFLGISESPEVAIILVALPTADPYPLAARVTELIGKCGATLVDLRDLEGIGPEDFPDGYHLGERGAALFTEALVEALSSVLEQSGTGTESD